MDAIASIFVNYHEERRELVEKTEAADLIEQNVAELMQLCYRGVRRRIADEGGPATHQLVAATVIRTGRGARRARDRHGTAARRRRLRPAQLLIQFVVLPRKMGTGRDSLETDENVVTCFIDGAATLKRARKQGLLRPVAPRSSSTSSSCSAAGVKDVFLFATEAGAPAWLTLGFEHVGSSASLIHLRFDLLFKRDRGVSRSARGPDVAPRSCSMDPRSRSSATPRASTPWSAVQERVAEYGEKQVVRLAKEAANAAPRPRPNDDERVVDDADADDEDEAWEPGRPSMMDLDDDEQEQAAKAKRKLKRAKKKSAKAKNAAGAAPHAPRRGWEESDEDDPVEDLIHRERIRERDLLRTPGCLALGRKAFRLEDMPPSRSDREILRRVLYILREAERRNCGELEVPRPREWALSELGDTMTTEAIRARFDLRRDDGVFCTAPGRAEVQIKELGFHFIDPLAPIAEKEIVPRVRVFIPYLGIEGWISITSRGPASFSTRPRASFDASRASPDAPFHRLDDGHLIVELKYLQAMHVKNRMLKKCCYTLYLLELADRLRGEASRETLKTARKNVVELDMALLAPDAAGVIRKFANAIARKAAEARGETFVPTPYDETAVDAVVVTAVPPVAPVVSAPAGPPLKALEGMTFKQCTAELDAAGVPKKAGRAAPRSPPSATSCAASAPASPRRRSRYAQPECGVRYPYGSKLGLFKGRVGGGVRYFERFASFSSATRVRERLDAFDSTLRPRETSARSSMCYRVIRDAKRRTSGYAKPRAEDDQCPAYYGVDYRTAGGKLTCQFTVHEGTKTLAQKSAPADRRPSREALRSLENAFSEFMPERFYGITDDAKNGCPKGKVLALASIPGSGAGRHGLIVFGLYDSKVEVSIQEKHRISEVVVARIEEHNVERAEAQKPLPPLHVAGALQRLERYKADFALQLKDLAYVEAADEAYLRDQAAALAPPEPMPDGSRPPIDAHSRRVARAGLANTFERMIERRRDRAAREREEAQARRRVPLLTMILCTSSAEFLSLFDESEVEMAAAMFDSRPIEIARPLLFESEEDASAPSRPRRSASASRAEEAQGRRGRRRRRRRGAGDEAAPRPTAPLEPGRARGARRGARRAAADGAARRGARRGAGAGRRAGQEEEEEAVARRAPPPAEISEYERTRMRNIAAGNKLYSLGLIHPPPEVVADPSHLVVRARGPASFCFAPSTRALPQAQS
ncbi:hypothetical protein JL722_641 [Aureococcus anophagefferens]|nr:hypothetical protein JL722_641 [Aureococcus anophagefferens]